MKTVVVTLMTLVLLSGSVSTLKAASDNEQAVAVDVMQWISLIDSGRYEESWTEASDYFRESLTEARWYESLEAVRKPLGQPVKREVVHYDREMELPGSPDGEYLIFTIHSSFEHKQHATETVIYSREPDGVWRAVGYYIR